MTASPSSAEFERRLSLLVGDDFERTVCRVLGDHHLDFQPVPREGGDGGVDGLSHGLTHAYCCYGPNVAGKGALDKDLRDRIVDKFRGDIRRIFEVEPAGKSKLVHAPNDVLAGVLDGQKLAAIRLVCNTFRDNRLIGKLNTIFRQAHKASKLNHVISDCALTIWGPRELGESVAVTEQTLYRIKNPELRNILETHADEMARPAEEQEEAFDDKFRALARKVPRALASSVPKLQNDYRNEWLRVLTMDQRLSAAAPGVYMSVQELRSSARRVALEAAMSGASPIEQLDKLWNFIRARLGDLLGNAIEAAHVEKLATGEVGRLIGHCYIEWRDQDDLRSDTEERNDK